MGAVAEGGKEGDGAEVEAADVKFGGRGNGGRATAGHGRSGRGRSSFDGDQLGGGDFVAGEFEGVLAFEAVLVVGGVYEGSGGEGDVVFGEAVVPVGEVVFFHAGVAVFPGFFEGPDFVGEFDGEAVAVGPFAFDADVAVGFGGAGGGAVNAHGVVGGPGGAVDSEAEGCPIRSGMTGGRVGGCPIRSGMTGGEAGGCPIRSGMTT